MNESEQSRRQWRALHGRAVARAPGRSNEWASLPGGAEIYCANRSIIVRARAGEPFRPNRDCRNWFGSPACALNYSDVAPDGPGFVTFRVVGPAREIDRHFGNASHWPKWCAGRWEVGGGRVIQCPLPSERFDSERAPGSLTPITGQSEPVDRDARAPGSLTKKHRDALRYRRMSRRARAETGADVVGTIAVSRDAAHPERFRARVR